MHHYLAYVVIGSLLLHIAVKLPDIAYGLRTRLADGDVLTETPWSDNPQSHSNAGGQVLPPPTPAITRRGLLLATGRRCRRGGRDHRRADPDPAATARAARGARPGPRGRSGSRSTAPPLQAGVSQTAMAADWTLQVDGDRPYRIDLAELEALADHEASLPISCVEGWSVGAHWRGVPLLDLVRRAGGDAGSRVRLVSLQTRGAFGSSTVEGPQLAHALLATHLNGARLDLDHGYPLRLIAPNRAGVLNTKWLTRIVVS